MSQCSNIWTMEPHTNRRGIEANVLREKHVKLEDLRKETRALENKYLYNHIPAFPRPEIHVSHLKHDTDLSGLEGIHRDGGFRGTDSLLWWSLAVKPEDITSAETRLLEETYPDRTEDQRQSQQSFLGKFATSPAFLETSRLGSYRFTFPVDEVLEAYSRQFCSGKEPVLQVYETALYKQEVMYVILVDTPQRRMPHPPLSDNPDAVCAYRDGGFIWRPEAMSGAHSFTLVQNPSEKQMVAEEFPGERFYVWDHVAVALRVHQEELLKFDTNKLRGNLKFCRPGRPRLTDSFQGFDAADELVRFWWPDFTPTPLEEERSLEEKQ